MMKRFFWLGIGLLLLVYLPALQTVPNGSSHYYMIDVGETQIVLNTWGTLHATGYPAYVITGNLLTGFIKLVGVNAVTAPAIVSLLWSLLALGMMAMLGTQVTPSSSRQPFVVLSVVLVFGLTRTVWIHSVIAEIYSFGLVLLVGLFLLALWRRPVQGRIYWLALLGGIAVAHHRAFVMTIPALLYAVWPELSADKRKLPRTVLMSLLIGLIGFIPYAYLYLRAQSGAAWVYGEPETLAGLWDQFIGTEASRFIGPAESSQALSSNFRLINDVLILDLTVPGILLGIIGLFIAIWQPHTRKPGITFLLSGLVAYGFHVIYYSDVLSALILSVTFSLAMGWLFLADYVVRLSRFALPVVLMVFILFGFTLFQQNQPFIEELTTDPTGLETIDHIAQAPPDSTVMLSWGPRHFAVGLARDVLHDERLGDIQLVDHKADFSSVESVVIPDYTIFNQPPDWWRSRMGGEVYVRAIAPRLVELRREPILTADSIPEGISTADIQLTCDIETLNLTVVWQSSDQPLEDLSVFVHLLNADGVLLAQDDQFAPVYGWRPLTTWQAGEQIQDIYSLPHLPDAELIRYGLYRVVDGFENVLEYEQVVACEP